MYKLSLTPDQAGYSIDEDGTASYTKLRGGAGRYRRDLLNATVKVNLQWSCTADEFEYLKTFWRLTNNGVEPFLMDLIIHDGALTEHICRFIPKSFKTTSYKNGNSIVQAVLEVEPLVGDPAMDEGVVTSFEAFGNDGSECYAILATLVNVDMPANIK